MNNQFNITTNGNLKGELIIILRDEKGKILDFIKITNVGTDKPRKPRLIYPKPTRYDNGYD